MPPDLCLRAWCALHCIQVNGADGRENRRWMLQNVCNTLPSGAIKRCDTLDSLDGPATVQK